MIQTLEIQNFKSIRYLQMDCRRVNLFIGEPNTGKSNILEALGLFSVPHTWEIRDFVRMESMDDLFYEHDISQKVMVRRNLATRQFEIRTRIHTGFTDQHG